MPRSPFNTTKRCPESGSDTRLEAEGYPLEERGDLRCILLAVAEQLSRIEHQMAVLSPPEGQRGAASVLSIKQVSKFVNLSESHIRRAIAKGDLPASNVGTAKRPLWRIARGDLDDGLLAKKGGAPVIPPKSELKDLIRRHLPGL